MSIAKPRAQLYLELTSGHEKENSQRKRAQFPTLYNSEKKTVFAIKLQYPPMRPSKTIIFNQTRVPYLKGIKRNPYRTTLLSVCPSICQDPFHQEHVEHRRVNPHFGFSITVASEYRFLRCVGKMMDSVSMFRLVYCNTSFTSGGWRTTATDAPIPLQFIDGTSTCTYELHTLQCRGCGHALRIFHDPIRSLALAGSASLFGRRRFGEFSGEGSAARRPLVRRCDVPKEFIWAPISDVEHPASDALDEFLYGLDTEVASDNVI
ncbi:hypothetical protein EVAR_14334_1 [Eumeta japonica]|uniref:Uncharacterized protein n=1 Tax=Eumeta variegata TaxID=151549 RepID=A0A4C1UNF8_EUMVA|nr:hypothetical protein EVAR_14334_1 [Eumeta japonica]